MRVSINLLGWNLDFALEPATKEYEEGLDPLNGYGSVGSTPIYADHIEWYADPDEDDDRKLGFPIGGKE